MAETDNRTATEIAAAAPRETLVAPITNRSADAPRAEHRGIYVDGQGSSRVVAAGDRIPEGWQLENDASLADRAGSTPTARDDAPKADKPDAPAKADAPAGLVGKPASKPGKDD